MTSWNPKTDPPFFPPLNPRISAAEYQAALGAKPKRRSKFNVDRSKEGIAARTVDGVVLDSVAEAKRWCQLILLQRGGFIHDLRRQTKFPFTLDGEVMFNYVSDFDYWEGCTYVIEDTKGVQTPVFRLKRKLIEKQHKIKIRLT